MDINTFYIVYAAILGLLVGSFLNVVILRLPPRLMWNWAQEAREFLELPDQDAAATSAPPGIVVKRSFCLSCQHQLSWWENIPLVSYILLRGKCRSCKSPISWQYPLVELAMGVGAAVAVGMWGWSVHALIASALVAVLIACSGIDFKVQLLPDQIVLPTLWSGLLLSLTPYAFVSPTASIVGAAVGYLSLWSVFWLFKLLTGKEGMGYGDFKLLAALGAFFGPFAIIPVLLIASVLGSVVGIVLLKTAKESRPFAFGPYLALGGIVYLYLGPSIVHIFPTPVL